jgi:hypothetical protein
MKKILPQHAVRLMMIFLAGLILFSCSGNKKPSPVPGKSGNAMESASAGTATSPGTLEVAPQIVYDVEILNPYPDDAWTVECLKDLNHKALVDFVFEGLYSGRFTAYDIFEGTAISAKKIRRMEENGEFSREQIGKFQFQEEWILDTVNMSFTKKVTEIRMGLQKFNETGELTGYTPLLRVVL